MDALDVTKMSSRGQVVIPLDVRQTLGLENGTRFVVYGQGDTVVLKRIGRPSPEEGKKLLADSRKLARRVRMPRTAVAKAITKARASR